MLGMGAFVSWVDYSAAERQRMRQAVALFEEKDTRDELGIGTIRDALADSLFPGTSVIQTRLRYALFIPWIYRRLEDDRRLTSANVERKAREDELALVAPLEASGAVSGIIGIQAGRALQRLPSSVYWLALQRWGILRRRITQDQYHREWDRLRRDRASQLLTDDAGILASPLHTWHPALPSPPEDFPGAADFELRPDEADFLRGRIAETCRGSLIAYAVAQAGACPYLDASNPWEAFAELPASLGDGLALARRFAFLIQGAALTYNLALARASQGREGLAVQLEGSVAAWADAASALDVASPPLDELWRFCAERANVRPRTCDFVEAWRQLLLTRGYEQATQSTEAHRLVEIRERQLKGSRARFGNPRALDTWNGQAGTGLLTYRWATVQRFLEDLYQGLARTGA